MQATDTHDHHHHDTHTHDHDVPHDHRRENAQAWVRVMILVGLAVYFAYNIVTGNLSNYINERFAWLSYLAVLLFGVLGAVSLAAMRRGEHLHHDHEGHDHAHSPIGWGIIAITAAPLLLGVLIPSRPLGAESVDGNISISPLNYGAAALINKAPEQRTVLDWLRAFSFGTQPTEFDGQPADVVGFIYREPDFPADVFMVARFTVSCCVADASAIGVPVQWADADTLPEGGWVQVQGAFLAGDFSGQTTPILRAQTVADVPQPEHPYLYP
ncbi:MAG: TIGR03943 family protein [Armatimonadetes bacterium]|nr:TIGR03943 family protein [Anaerolineae bacterium]